MTPNQLTYLIFGIVMVLALIFDLGLLSKRSSSVTMRKALFQTCFWLGLSLAFFGFMWYENGADMAVSYISAYLMEWSLSIDNIFVFILIFSAFKIRESNIARVLLIGILIAILLRVVFISIGVALIAKFSWLLYIFGAILIYTGIKMFTAEKEKEFDKEGNAAYRVMKKYLRITDEKPAGRFIIRKNDKAYFTNLTVVVVLLAVTDVVFALDSIPAVFAISSVPLVVYTSNIFAVLGLRSLFFLLRSAVDKFEYLQHGIAIVLVFIGLKMLAEIFKIHLPVYVSLIVIVGCLLGAIFYSIYRSRKING